MGGGPFRGSRLTAGRSCVPTRGQRLCLGADKTPDGSDLDRPGVPPYNWPPFGGPRASEGRKRESWTTSSSCSPSPCCPPSARGSCASCASAGPSATSSPTPASTPISSPTGRSQLLQSGEARRAPRRSSPRPRRSAFEIVGLDDAALPRAPARDLRSAARPLRRGQARGRRRRVGGDRRARGRPRPEGGPWPARWPGTSRPPASRSSRAWPVASTPRPTGRPGRRGPHGGGPGLGPRPHLPARRMRGLADAIAERGGAVVSEFPLGTPPEPVSLPAAQPRHRGLARRPWWWWRRRRRAGRSPPRASPSTRAARSWPCPATLGAPGRGHQPAAPRRRRLVRDAADVAEWLGLVMRVTPAETRPSGDDILDSLRRDRPPAWKTSCHAAAVRVSELLSRLSLLEMNARVRRLPGPAFVRS